MRQQALKFTLIEDVVVNERAATEGGHAGLDYLPGMLLLGAAAARLYAGLSRPDAYRLFHAGQVRFGDALPLADDRPCWPMPLCWHEQKGVSAVSDGRLDADKVRNLQFGGFPDGIQPKQLRAGYVRTDGYRLSVRQALRMKTAIDPQTGRVAEAQLFGYEAIAAGQAFVARIQGDDDLPDALWDALIAALSEAGELLLGRSRSAEYGRVRVAIWNDTATLEPAEAKAGPPRQLTLWCLSDLALLDDWGQPTLAPTPAALGLTRGAIDWEHSFLRFRRYAIWNAYRDGYDLERQVVQRGSVITLTLKEQDPPWTAGERAQFTGGVGMHREAGLGWVCLDAQLLAQALPTFTPEITPTLPVQVAAPPHPLIAWLKAGQSGDASRSTAEQAAREQKAELKERYRLARAFAGVAERLPIGPSPSQWGSVYERARLTDSGDLPGLRRALCEGTDAICKPQGEGWQDQFRDATGVRTFHAWFQETATQLASVAALRVFAREAQRVAQGEHGRADRMPPQEKSE